MKKVAIVTIISMNYGNRLQNYALQTVLDSKGFKCETIPIRRDMLKKIILKIFLKTFLSLFISKYKNVCWDKFNLRISWSRYILNSHDINNQYNYFVAGSDQIWNPMFKFNSDREFLSFVCDEKKISYAASFGIEELPKEYVDLYRERLKKFRSISVREYSAAAIIKELGMPKPMVVLDPTMLLSADQWLKIAKKMNYFSEKRYVVKYFLGKQDNNIDEIIKKKALEFNASVIDISSNNYLNQCKVGPAEFISLFYYSKAVFTDSFHGSVFSIIFHKPFWVFDRPYEEGAGTMTSRLDTLLDTFELKKQRINNLNLCKNKSMEWDYSKVENIISKKRTESLDFLDKAMNIHNVIR